MPDERKGIDVTRVRSGVGLIASWRFPSLERKATFQGLLFGEAREDVAYVRTYYTRGNARPKPPSYVCHQSHTESWKRGAFPLSRLFRDNLVRERGGPPFPPPPPPFLFSFFHTQKEEEGEATDGHGGGGKRGGAGGGQGGAKEMGFNNVQKCRSRKTLVLCYI